MRSLFCILFSGWFLLGSFMPGNDAEELAKVPLLVQHFQEHQRLDAFTDFISFLKEHYDESLPDGEEHKDLPFAKHLQPCLIFVLPAVSALAPPSIAYFFLPKHFPEFEPSLLTATKEAWQPPRLV